MKMSSKRHLPTKEEVKRLHLVRISEEHRGRVADIVVREYPLTIVFNGTELVTLLCTPTKLKHLAVGFLFSEGLLNGRKDIKKVTVDQERGVAWVDTKKGSSVDAEFLAKRYITTGCGKGTSFSAAGGKNIRKVNSVLKVKSSFVLDMMSMFQERSDIHRMTGGVHNAALCDRHGIVLFSEDIGRHSAIDKILGEGLMKDLPMNDHILITSGRISSEIVLKTARAGIPIIVSKSAPTDLGVKLAEQSGITLIGFVRGRRMNVYSNERRITSSPLRP
jgi:FdhD protein